MRDIYKPEVGDKVRLKTLEEIHKTPGLGHIEGEFMSSVRGKVFRVIKVDQQLEDRLGTGRLYYAMDIQHGTDLPRRYICSDLYIKIN